MKDLKLYIEEGGKIGEQFSEYAKNFFDRKTVEAALNENAISIKDWGASTALRNLLCCYGYDGSDFATILKNEFMSTEEKEKEENDKIKGLSQNKEVNNNNQLSEINSFDFSTEDYKILILPFRNPDNDYAI